MSYTYNGQYRCKTLTIDLKDAAGVSQTGYPKTYVITDAFGSYGALTDQEFQKLTSTEYNTRLADFYQYVEGLSQGLALPGSIITGGEPTGTDLASCVIGTELPPEV